MDNVLRVVKWLESFFVGGATIVEWFVTPMNFIGISLLTPLELLSISGLLTFLAVAIGKWLIQ